MILRGKYNLVAGGMGGVTGQMTTETTEFFKYRGSPSPCCHTTNNFRCRPSLNKLLLVETEVVREVSLLGVPGYYGVLTSKHVPDITQPNTRTNV